MVVADLGLRFPNGVLVALDDFAGFLDAAAKIYVCHDYQPGGRELAFETTVAAQKRSNIQLPAARSKAEFVEFRSARDATLAAPRLLFQSVQVNIDAGALPAASASSRRFLKIPLRVPPELSEDEQAG